MELIWQQVSDSHWLNRDSRWLSYWAVWINCECRHALYTSLAVRPFAQNTCLYAVGHSTLREDASGRLIIGALILCYIQINSVIQMVIFNAKLSCAIWYKFFLLGKA